MLVGMWPGLKQAREVVTDAASKVAETAADTKAAVLGALALAGVALLVGLVALVMAVKGRKVVTA